MRNFITAVLSLWIITTPAALAGQSAEELAQDVTIRRTAYGVPHILASTEKAAAFGFAWAQCEDHFPLVYKSMVRGRSELSRYYGGTSSNLESDFHTLHFGARQLAVDTYHLLSQCYRDVQEGFAAGINYYMERHPEEVESWMTPVTPHDVAAMRQVAVMRFTYNRGNIIQRFLRDQNRTASVAFPSDLEAVGSNTIALSPDRTASSKAILLNNPHQPWSEQANYYEAHITVPGIYNFYGTTFIGGPILTTGFNRYLGWAHTVNYPDLEEIYEVDLDLHRPDHYRFDGSSVPMTSEMVTLPGQDGESVSRTLWSSPLGPVIHKTDTKAYILKSVGYTQFRAGEQWYEMAKATNLEEFREVLRMQEIAMFNIGYADRDGNIMYLWNGTVPDFPHPNKVAEAVPASNSNEIWTRIHPLEDLMQLINPRGGYIQNCNSPPYFTNLHEPLNRSAYPPHFPNNNLSLRTQHGLGLVHNNRIFTLEDVVEAKFSMGMTLADRVKDDLINALEAVDLNRDEQRAVRILKQWDNSVSRNSVGSVLFTTWWSQYTRGSSRNFDQNWSEDDPVNTPRGLGNPERAVETFRNAMDEVVEKWGRLDVSWGHVHRLRRGNLDVPIGGGDGGMGCFRVLVFSEDDDGKRFARSGDSYISAIEFGDNPRAYSVLAYSQSGRPGSKHYNDQSRLFAENRMKKVAFTEDEIREQLLRKYHPGK